MLRRVLPNRHALGLAVGSAGRAEDHTAHLGSFDCLEHAERPRGVVVVVAKGLVHRFADVSERGEMHDAIDTVLFEHAGKRISLPHVELEKADFAGKRLAMAAAQIVERERRMPSRAQAPDCMRADVSRRSGDENVHADQLSLRVTTWSADPPNSSCPPGSPRARFPAPAEDQLPPGRTAACCETSPRSRRPGFESPRTG